MKNILYLTIACFSVTSRIREAPLNPEADIEEFTVDAEFLSSSTIIDQANSKILIYLKPDAYQSGVSPTLKLSKGVTVTPVSGTFVTFSLITVCMQESTGISAKDFL